MIWQPEFTDKTLSRKPGAVQSTNQLKVCVFYAMGVPYDAIAQNCRLSPETVRTYLKRSLKNLNLEGYDALRSAVLMRTFVFMISNTAKENEKM
ncbi:TPA: helix-turn-helix transcriptional regulator [Escherichia coli]